MSKLTPPISTSKPLKSFRTFKRDIAAKGKSPMLAYRILLGHQTIEEGALYRRFFKNFTACGYLQGYTKLAFCAYVTSRGVNISRSTVESASCSTDSRRGYTVFTVAYLLKIADIILEGDLPYTTMDLFFREIILDKHFVHWMHNKARKNQNKLRSIEENRKRTIELMEIDGWYPIDYPEATNCGFG